MVEDETPSALFFKIEDNTQGKREIREITQASGSLTTDPDEITRTFQQYYADLYDYEATSNEVQDKFLEFVTPLE